MIGVVATLTACTSAEESTPPTVETPQQGVPGNVTRVTDGDSIEVETAGGTITVRLVAINAPERGECFHDEARDHLIDSLENTTVTLEVVGVDQFDRTLAHVFEDSRHINLELVSDGLALASSPEDGDPYRAVILDAEEEAFAAGTGLWGAGACGAVASAPRVVIDGDASSPDPDGPDQEAIASEVMAITNEGGAIVDLSGWILRDASSRHRFTFPPGSSLGPGEVMTVSSAHPGWSPGGEPVWNNDGDMALLQTPNGTIVSRWRY